MMTEGLIYLFYTDLISTDTLNNKLCLWYEARIPITDKHDHLPHF